MGTFVQLDVPFVGIRPVYRLAETPIPRVLGFLGIFIIGNCKFFRN